MGKKGKKSKAELEAERAKQEAALQAELDGRVEEEDAANVCATTASAAEHAHHPWLVFLRRLLATAGHAHTHAHANRKRRAHSSLPPRTDA